MHTGVDDAEQRHRRLGRHAAGEGDRKREWDQGLPARGRGCRRNRGNPSMDTAADAAGKERHGIEKSDRHRFLRFEGSDGWSFM